MKNAYSVAVIDTLVMDHQSIHRDMSKLERDLSPDIRHSGHKRPDMGQHISGWRMLYFLGNRYSWHTRDDIRYMDHRNTLEDRSKNQLH